MNLMQINDEQYKELKTKYIKAKNAGDTQFVVFGQECLTDFAKYWLQAIEQYRKTKGLSIITESKQMTHNCNDGTKYTWLTRTIEPKLCPRCKARINKTR